MNWLRCHLVVLEGPGVTSDFFRTFSIVKSIVRMYTDLLLSETDRPIPSVLLSYPFGFD